MQVCNLKKNNCEKIYAKQLQFLCRRVLYNHQCHVHEKVYMIWSERSGASVIATALGQDIELFMDSIVSIRLIIYFLL